MNRTGFVAAVVIALMGVVLLPGGLLFQAALPDNYNLGIAFYFQQSVALCCILTGVFLGWLYCGPDRER